MTTDSVKKPERRKNDPYRNGFIEACIALAFILSILVASPILMLWEAGAGKFLAAALPTVVLAIWAWAYFKRFERLDELERLKELTSFAIGFGFSVLLMTIIGIASDIAGTPEIPLAMAAPLAAVLYGAARTISHFKYR